VRYRLMATYDGSPFEAGIGPAADDIVLFAACPPPEELGFEPATGHWRKRVRFADVEAVWESRPVGAFRGDRCLVLDDLGDRLHIGYLGHDAEAAERLGYWQVDRGVFELIAPRSEVTGILEERLDVPAPVVRPGARAATAVPAPDDRTGVTLPAPPATPLPLEAEAMRAASAVTGPAGATLRPAVTDKPAPTRLSAEAPAQSLAAVPAASEAPEPPPARAQSRKRRGARRRKDAEQLDTPNMFADLAGLAGIPGDLYSVGEEVDGAMCLLETEQGFEVFLAAGGARHEQQIFVSEEAACFYLFGVLVAEEVRTGALARVPGTAQSWRSQTA
jgi:hypothetical protein